VSAAHFLLVMRYSPYSQEISKIVSSRSLGELVNIVQVEPVGHYHFAHSFVRGNWANEEQSSFSLLTKCCQYACIIHQSMCHQLINFENSCSDIDIICKWFAPSTPVRISSFGSLRHFQKSAKPPEAGMATRCLKCPIEKDCPYSAKKSMWSPH
jgi:hypothetical protein